MLGWILEKTTAVVSETYDGVATVADYIVEDIKSIPDSIEKGWDEGIFKSNYEETLDKVVEKHVDKDTI